ncbi:WcbI family polysaccharide biosynthesis putative acetyltransferase [Burkholderia thailandensis]|uniref:WcbI family polysaccharide biosynthesis putative acetyltransferase n=1 Tax=Burkholderia thailandensis TaxID=57975 RepID=UPI0018C7A6B9|nr:WcbI family polysaccharide biosynthesis putative acetyltransferase [Burkholderia thailandensis]
MKEKWLVISNCQTTGMMLSLAMMCPDVKVDACDYWGFQANSEFWRQQIPTYDHIVVNPEIQQLGIVDFATMPNATMLLAIRFRAYHPDLQNVFHDGKSVKTPLDDYHSTIVFAAYKLGCTIGQARALFNEAIYDALQYFSLWDIERKLFLDMYAEYGWDLSSELSRWTRGSAFMHTMNHPKAHALYDVALMVARKVAGDRVVESGIVPHDTLVQAPVYPIYPELAERFGAGRGSYLFKGMNYQLLTLDAFIEGSFDAYAAFDKNQLHGNSPHLASALHIIEAAL